MGFSRGGLNMRGEFPSNVGESKVTVPFPKFVADATSSSEQQVRRHRPHTLTP